VSALRPLYDYAWFVGFGTAAIVHLALMRILPPSSPVAGGTENPG